MVSHRFDGSTTRSYVPASTEGARQLLGQELGQPASSASQSQSPADVGPVRNSQPRPTGGASVRMVSKPLSERASASSWACSRTRCWVARVPLRSAR